MPTREYGIYLTHLLPISSERTVDHHPVATTSYPQLSLDALIGGFRTPEKGTKDHSSTAPQVPNPDHSTMRTLALSHGLRPKFHLEKKDSKLCLLGYSGHLVPVDGALGP